MTTIKPVAALIRHRRPEKGMDNWSDWVMTRVDLNKPSGGIDSVGWEYQYQLLYEQPVKVIDELKRYDVDIDPMTYCDCGNGRNTMRVERPDGDHVDAHEHTELVSALVHKLNGRDRVLNAVKNWLETNQFTGSSAKKLHDELQLILEDEQKKKTPQ